MLPAMSSEPSREAPTPGVQVDAVAAPGRSGRRGPEAASYPLPVAEVLPDGRRKIADPSPMSGMSHGQRLRRMEGILERAALAGDVSAAREWLAHHRWKTEMKHGKPTQRTEVAGAIVAKIVDDVSTIPEAPARALASMHRRLLTGRPVASDPGAGAGPGVPQENSDVPGSRDARTKSAASTRGTGARRPSEANK